MAKQEEEILITVDVDAESSEKRTKRLNAELKQAVAMQQALIKANKESAGGLAGFEEALEKSEKQIKETTAALRESEKVLALENKVRTSAAGSIDQMRARLALLVPQYAALGAAERESAEGGQALAAEIAELTTTLKANADAQRENQRILELENKVRTAAAGSINQQRAQLSLLKAQYLALSAAEATGTKEGKALEKQIRELSDSLKEQEEALGDTRRNVGNYGAALVDVEDKLGLFGGTLGDIRGKLTGFKEGLTAMKAGLTGIKGAIAATGIGLLLLVLGAIYGALTRTQAGMDKVARVTAQISAAFTVLIDRGAKLTQALRALFSGDLAAAAERFGQVFHNIGQDIAAAADAAEKTTLASQKLREAERKLRVDRANSRAEVERLKKISEDVFASEQQRLAAAQGAYNTEQGLLKRQIELQQKKIANLKAEAGLNGNLVDDLDRVADAEEELGNLREESFGKQTELQNKINEIRIQTIQNAAAKEIATQQEVLDIYNAQTEFIYETEVERADKILEIRKAILDAQRKYDLAGIVANSNQALAIEAKYNADLAKLNYDSLTEQNENETKIQLDGISARASLEREGSVERLRIYQEELEAKALADSLEANRTIKSQEALTAALLAIDRKYQADTKANRQAIRDEQFRIQGELLEAGLARAEEGSAKEYRIQLKQIKLKAQAAIENETLAQEEIYKIVAQSQKEEENLRKKRATEVANRITELASQATDFASKILEAGIQRETKALEQQQQAQLDNALLTADQRTAIEKDFAEKKQKLELDAAKKRKNIARVENIINTARAITAAFSAGPLGPVLAAIAAAVGAAQQIVIESQQFAYGGIPLTAAQLRRRRYRGLVDGPGTTTSDSIPAQLSTKESVMNARTTAKYYDQLSAMNVDGGGVPFPGAKPVAVPQLLAQVRTQAATNGGSVPGYITAAGVGLTTAGTPASGIETGTLAAMIEQGVGRALDKMPPQRLVVSDYERESKKVKVLAAMADV